MRAATRRSFARSSPRACGRPARRRTPRASAAASASAAALMGGRRRAASAQPFFFYYAPHNTHEPLEAPAAQLAKFDFVYNDCAAAAGLPALGAGRNNTCAAAVADGGVGYDKADKQCCFRQYYSAMTNLVDAHIGQVVIGHFAHVFAV